MTPDPPAPSEGSPVPPRHRPTLGNLAHDTTETDLWALEDDLELPGGEIEPAAAPEGARSYSRDIPAPREFQSPKPRQPKNSPASPPAGGEDKIRINVTKKLSKNRPTGPVEGLSKSESEFDDLEHWEDAEVEPEIEDLPDVELPTEVLPVTRLQPEPPVAETPPEETAAAASSAKDSTTDDEFSPGLRENAVPISLRPHLQLSKAERIGLIALLIILLGGGVTVFLSSLSSLPVESAKAEANDFPIKGEHISITSATSYWRVPIREGPDADTFRRGTELLPVLELTVSGGPATIRVFFHDDEGKTIGDAITRLIRSGEVIKIPATAGFQDLGMHSAYRMGTDKPWTIEVLEILSGASSDEKSNKLFDMNISTTRR